MPDAYLEHLKYVTTLRSDKKITKIAYPNPEASKPYAISCKKLEHLRNKSETMSEEKGKEPMPYQIPALFPQRL